MSVVSSRKGRGLRYPLDQFFIRQAVERVDRQLRDEGLARLPGDAFAAPQVQHRHAGEAAEILQTGVRQFTAACSDMDVNVNSGPASTRAPPAPGFTRLPPKLSSESVFLVDEPTAVSRLIEWSVRLLQCDRSSLVKWGMWRITRRTVESLMSRPASRRYCMFRS